MTIDSLIVPDLTRVGSLPDVDLLALQASISKARRRWDAAAATVSAEVARRSARELGSSGLAQRAGARTPEILIQQVTGVTHAEARTLTRVGAVLDGQSPWLGSVATAVTAGSLSLAAAEAIAMGLGAPSPTVAPDDLSDAASRLVEAAPALVPEALAAEARAARDDLDAAGVGDREVARREQRFVRLIPQADGMTRIIGLLDPESAAVVVAAVDAVTSPRRGGPRFIDPADVQRAEELLDDSRTIEQITADALVDMVRVATRADAHTLFGDRTPAVRIHVRLTDLEGRDTVSRGARGSGAGSRGSRAARGGAASGRGGSGLECGVNGGLEAELSGRGRGSDGGNNGGEDTRIPGYERGVGRIEGQTASISIESVERHMCDTGFLPILFDHDKPIDVGRNERLFTYRQRAALASQFGGCAWPGCDRPPSWCEAHHITGWDDRGPTDLDNGILLCAHHHRLLHNNRWQIRVISGSYLLVPPPDVDPSCTPRPMRSRGRPPR